MPPPTDPSPPKRARVHEPAASNPSPLEAAKATIASTVASLLPPLQSFSLSFANKSLALFQQVSDRKQTLASLEKPDYIPRSIRSSFQLNVTKRVSETAEFKALQAQTTAILARRQAELKHQIVSAAKLEINHLHSLFIGNYAATAGYLIKCFLTADDDEIPPTDDNISSIGSMIFKQSSMTTDNDAATIQAAFLPYSATSLTLQVDIDLPDSFQSVIGAVSAAVHALCIAPCTRYTEQAKVTRTEARLLAIGTDNQLDSLAADTTMLIDDEPPVQPQLLASMIDKAVDNALARRTTQPSLKRSSRGRRGQRHLCQRLVKKESRKRQKKPPPVASSPQPERINHPTTPDRLPSLQPPPAPEIPPPPTIARLPSGPPRKAKNCRALNCHPPPCR